MDVRGCATVTCGGKSIGVHRLGEQVLFQVGPAAIDVLDEDSASTIVLGENLPESQPERRHRRGSRPQPWPAGGSRRWSPPGKSQSRAPVRRAPSPGPMCTATAARHQLRVQSRPATDVDAPPQSIPIPNGPRICRSASCLTGRQGRRSAVVGSKIYRQHVAISLGAVSVSVPCDA